MILKSIKNNRAFRSFYKKQGGKWVRRKIESFEHSLSNTDKILDLGSGNCMVANHLLIKGHDITALDVKNLSIIDEITPVIFDGTRIPFENDSFDAVLILTVLHHSDNPIALIQEAKRVGKEIFIIEDTYKHLVQKKLTQSMDTLMNFGHSNMTYQNKSEKAWESVFTAENLEVIRKTNKRVLLFFQQTMYHLRKS